MNTTKQIIKNNVCENMTQIQEDLEVLLNKIFEQIGTNMKAEKQAEYTQALKDTKEVIERFKSKYCTYNL